jgi:GDPmannose 4,6-dehydratase
MNFSSNSDDFVIGSGLGTSIEELLNITFSEFNLDYNKYVVVDSSLLRIGDPQKIISDPTNLKNKTGWYPKLNIQQLIERCISFKLNKP